MSKPSSRVIRDVTERHLPAPEIAEIPDYVPPAPPVLTEAEQQAARIRSIAAERIGPGGTYHNPEHAPPAYVLDAAPPETRALWDAAEQAAAESKAASAEARNIDVALREHRAATVAAQRGDCMPPDAAEGAALESRSAAAHRAAEVKAHAARHARIVAEAAIHADPSIPARLAAKEALAAHADVLSLWDALVAAISKREAAYDQSGVRPTYRGERHADRHWSIEPGEIIRDAWHASLPARAGMERVVFRFPVGTLQDKIDNAEEAAK